MKKHVLIVFLCLLPAALGAQTKTGASGIIDAIARSCGSMESLECNFIQTRHSKMLSEDIKSEGRMSYKRPDVLLWEYTSPKRHSFAMKGAKVTMKNAEGAEVADSGSKKAFREIARLMTGSLTGEMLADGRGFSADAAEKGGEWVVTLTPVRKDLQQMLSSMTMYYDTQIKSVVKVELMERSGDYTTIVFKNIRYEAAR